VTEAAPLTPRQIKNRERRAWDEVADGWRRHGEVLGALAPVTETLLDLAEVRPGQWVLDVATGLGEPALTLAERVGPAGKVVGVDLSPKMIVHAEARARAAGRRNAGFHVLDAEELLGWPEAGYDAAVCRFGLAYLPELFRALRGVHHVLTARAPFASAVWAAPERVPFLKLAQDTVLGVTGLPAPGPGPPHAFALAERGRLEQALSSAGFEEIRGQRVAVSVTLPSPEAYVQVVRETTRLGALIEEHERRDEAWAALVEAARAYGDGSGGVVFPCEVTCVVGRRG
jgi:SAM-dependent methyltransferase